MKNPEIREELKPYEAELTAAAKRGDMVEFRRIVEAAGVTWIERELPEKYKTGIDRQMLREGLVTPPIFVSGQNNRLP